MDGLCRACCLHIDQHGPETREQPWTQLWFGGDLAPSCVAVRDARLCRPAQKARARATARRPPAPPVSPHLAVPGQGVLFNARRDWSCIAVGSLGQLPSLTPAAQALLAEFREHARARGWEEEVRRRAARSLRIVLAWVGADTPVHEADIRGISADRPGTSARRPVQFLASRNLIIPDPPARLTPTSRPSSTASAGSPPGSPASSAAGCWSCGARAAASTGRWPSRRSGSTSATSIPS
jgi:hypothetical protein